MSTATSNGRTATDHELLERLRDRWADVKRAEAAADEARREAVRLRRAALEARAEYDRFLGTATDPCPLFDAAEPADLPALAVGARVRFVDPTAAPGSAEVLGVVLSVKGRRGPRQRLAVRWDDGTETGQVPADVEVIGP